MVFNKAKDSYEFFESERAALAEKKKNVSQFTK